MTEKLKLEDATVTVYGYKSEEIRSIADKLLHPYPHALNMGWVLPAGMKSLQTPFGEWEGEGGLDTLHEPIIDRFIKLHEPCVPGLVRFPYRYPVAGSTEGIAKLMWHIARTLPSTTIYVWQGEYEGYRHAASWAGLDYYEVSPETHPRHLKPGVWLISNPSARDGNVVPNEKIWDICESGHKVVLDLAYLGTTVPYMFSTYSEKIIAVLTSFSKPYGMFSDRVGFVFSRSEIDSLEGNKWFKPVPGLLLANAIMEQLDHKAYFDRLRKWQQIVVEGLNSRYDLKLKASDACMLAYDSEPSINHIRANQLKRFLRSGGHYRLCLTRFFLRFDPGAVHLFTELGKLGG